MSWQNSIQRAENILASGNVPPSEEIISLIKRVNPTNLGLSERDRHRGYEVKGRLQNLLLENYGEGFHLVTLPYDTDIVLIKHRHLPSVDACHANLNRLSSRALSSVGEGSAPQGKPSAHDKKNKRGKTSKASSEGSPDDLLRKAQQLLAEFDYDGAKGALEGMVIGTINEVPTLVRAVHLLIDEMAAFETAIDILSSQPKQVARDKEVRELLALTYYKNGMLPEARAVFDLIPLGDLSKEALSTSAAISLQDGNPQLAFALLNKAEGKEGFISAFPTVRAGIEKALREEAEPYYLAAKEAFDRNEFTTARALASQALELSPQMRSAGEIVKFVDQAEEEDRVKALWRDVENAGTPEKKLLLLTDLQKIDPKNKSKIKTLVESESREIRAQQSRRQIADYARLVEKQGWDEVYDRIVWIIQYASDAEIKECGELCKYFKLLHKNKGIKDYSDQNVRSGFLEIIRYDQIGEGENKARIYRDLVSQRPLFGKCQLYIDLLSAATKAAKSEAMMDAESLIEKLSQPGIAASDLNEIISEINSKIKILDENERGKFVETIDRFSKKSIQIDPEETYNNLVKSALKGDVAKIKQLKGRMEEGAIEDDLLEGFEEALNVTVRLEVEAVDVSPMSIFDRMSNHEPCEERIVGSTRSKIFLWEESKSILMVDVDKKEALRFKSKIIGQFNTSLELVDAVETDDTYLFYADNSVVIKIRLSQDDARILSLFPVVGLAEQGMSLTNIYMSSDKNSHYYLAMRKPLPESGDSAAKIFFRKVDVNSGRMGNEFVVENYGWRYGTRRFTSHPDRYVAWGSDTVIVFNKDIKVSGRRVFGDDDHSIAINVVSVDIDLGVVYISMNNNIYALGYNDHVLNRIVDDCKTDEFFNENDPIGINLEDKVIAFSRKGDASSIFFYKYESNSYSKYYSGIAYTKTPLRTYSLKMDKKTGKIKIKETTDQLGRLLEWRANDG